MPHAGPEERGGLQSQPGGSENGKDEYEVSGEREYWFAKALCSSSAPAQQSAW